MGGTSHTAKYRNNLPKFEKVVVMTNSLTAKTERDTATAVVFVLQSTFKLFRKVFSTFECDIGINR